MIRVSCVVSSSLPSYDANPPAAAVGAPNPRIRSALSRIEPDAISVGNRRGEHDPEHDDHAGHDEERVDDQVAQAPGGVAAARLQRPRERRNEGRRHGAFREEIADEIGNAEGDVERIHRRRRGCAEERREDGFADDAQQAARHGGDTDEARRPGHPRAHGLSKVRRPHTGARPS